jgi:hypothetical protein
VSDLVSRKRLSGLAGQQMGGARDLYEVMGYPRQIVAEMYAEIYLRQDIAGRIVDAFPDTTWREAPGVVGSDAFTAAWTALDDRFSVWRTLHRLDRLTGMGHYGVLLFGLDGGEPMHTPAEGNSYNLLYMQPHSERTAQVTAWEDNPQSPRYGMPKMYDITTGVNWTGSGAGQRRLNVHHSRVLHVAERQLEDVSIGTPRLERVWNRLMDLDKLMGGSAEMYWQNVAMMMAFMADAETEIDPASAKDMKAQLEEMQNGLRRFLQLQGVTAQNLAPGLQGSDPGQHIDKQLDIIAGSLGMPKRVLIGSERGELSSAQDENNWSARITERREQFAGPTVVDGFIAKCQRFGILPDGYQALEWPESDTLGEETRADIALKKAQAVATYAASPGAEMIVTPEEFRFYLGETQPLPTFKEDEPLGEDQAVIQFNKMRGK